jgi:hypothetical protein
VEKPPAENAQPANPPARRRRINKTTETSALPVDLSYENKIEPEASLLKAEAVAEDDWEKDFFQNGIARVLITDMEDSMMMESDSMYRQSALPVRPEPVPVENNKVAFQTEQVSEPLRQDSAPLLRNDMAEQSAIAAERRIERLNRQKQNAERTALEMARQTGGQSMGNIGNVPVMETNRELKIHSDDPRTREIFENLFAQRAEAAQPSPQRNVQAAANVRNIDEVPPLLSAQAVAEVAEPVSDVAADQLGQKNDLSAQNTAEHEFSNFLEAMFNAGETVENDSGDVASLRQEPKRKKEALQKSEQELMDFLSRL